MLIKRKKRPDGITIYRKGLGYMLKVLQAMNEYSADEAIKTYLLTPGTEMPSINREIIILALRIFTDIKNPVRLTKNDMKKALQIMFEAIKFNSPPSVFKSGQGAAGEAKPVDELAAGMIDTLAAAYGWTIDYILENIDLYSFIQLRDAIQRRQADEMMIDTIAAHDPKQILELSNKMKGIELISWGEFLNG